MQSVARGEDITHSRGPFFRGQFCRHEISELEERPTSNLERTEAFNALFRGQNKAEFRIFWPL